VDGRLLVALRACFESEGGFVEPKETVCVCQRACLLDAEVESFGHEGGGMTSIPGLKDSHRYSLRIRSWVERFHNFLC